MWGGWRHAADGPREGGRGRLPLLLLSAAAVATYVVLAVAGNLRERPFMLVAAHSVLAVLMLLALRVVRRGGSLRLAIVACLVFRVVACLGEPWLSDDVYRYVWDGRVQLHGHHPYRYAPQDPELYGLRDESWSRINHPELRTIYPPASETLFLALASCGLGPTGFRLAMGALDFLAVLALGHLLRRLSLPPDRLILYGWHPLAVMESAGSGHVEPLGVLLLLLGAATIIDRRRALAPNLALAAAIQVKLLPVVLVPAFVRRTGLRGLALLVLASLLLLVPYAVTGPAVGSGLFDYARTWEYNAAIYALVQGALEWWDATDTLKSALAWLQHRVDAPEALWTWLYAHVWPRELARGVVGVLAVIWVAIVTRRAHGSELRKRNASDPSKEFLLVLGAILLLSPTLHPWYLLWILPWAAARLSWPWIVLGLTVVLAYAGGADPPPGLRLLEYAPPLAVALLVRFRRLVPRP